MKYIYEESEYYDTLDDVVFHAERLLNKIDKRTYFDMSDRELLRNALDICVKLRSNKQ